MKKYKYPEPDNNRIFELDYISENGTAYFKCGHAVTDLVFEDMIDLETGLAKWELTTKTYQMNKLNKPRAFAASPNSILVTFGTEEREVTNLTRSAIMVQTEVLVADGGKWHEIEVADLALDSVHLPSFKNYVEQHGILLSDLGIIESEPMTNHELKHDDFMSLQTAYPKHSYIDIQKLHRYENERGNPSSRAHLIKVLKAISQEFLHIDGWIGATEERRDAMLKASETTLLESIVPERDAYNPEAVDESKEQLAIVVESVSPTEEAIVVESVSISIFDNLTPAKITELSILRKEQEQIVKDNPVVIITDKTTYASAKKTKAVLLSASTRINGKNGVFTLAKKCLNDFKKAFDLEGDNIEALARVEHDKQAKLITDWDNRLLLQQQNRIKELTSVPFTYESATGNYFIGSLIVTQKDIENDTDEIFSAWINKGRAVKIAMDSLKTEQDTKIAEQEKQIQELKAMLEQLLPKKEVVENVVFETSVVTDPFGATPSLEEAFDLSATVGTQSVEQSIPTPKDFAETAGTTQFTGRGEQKEQEQPKLPNPNNKLLNTFYMRNLEIVESKRFQEDAALFAQVLDAAGFSIQEILLNPDKTIQKSVAITELIKTWKL